MRIAFINRTDYGSSGLIARTLFEHFKANDYEAIFIGAEQSIKEGGYSVDTNGFVRQINRLTTKISGGDAFHNKNNTKKVINILKEFKPDFVSIHTLHGYYINMPMLISFLNENNIEYSLTCHDCWLFTGKCPHFEQCGCYKWESECKNCPQLKLYPKALFDGTNKFFNKKKALLQNRKNAHVIVPSYWLYNIAKKSYLKDGDINCIHNGVDLSIMHSEEESPFKDINKKVLLFVAFPWYENKGVSTIEYLANNLNKDEYQLVVIGSNGFDSLEGFENVTFVSRLPREQLFAYYKNAYAFINPTLEDNLPTVNIESLALGTPIIGYDTGGSKEIIGNCGVVVQKNDKKALEAAIKGFDKNKYSADECKKQSALFSKEKMCENYEQLIKKILKEKNNG